jgi:hypothetical protein
MLLFIATFTLAATPFNARIAPDAQLAVHLPKAAAAANLRPFLEHAGNYTALLRPEAWRDDAHPLLGIDVTRPETMEAAGIDIQGPLTVSVKGDWAFTCLRVKNAAAYDKAAGARLATLGTRFRKTQGTSTVVGAKDALGRVLAGYVSQGTLSCAMRSPNGDGEAVLKSMTGWMSQAPWSKWKPTVALTGDAWLLGASGAAAIGATATTASVDAVNTEGLMPPLSAALPFPYQLEGPKGLLKLRGQYAQEGLLNVVDNTRRALSRLCPRCEKAALANVTAALEKHMTGNVMLFIAEAKVQGPLRLELARFTALKAAALIELRSAEAALAMVEPWELFIISGKAPLTVSVQGSHLVLANDAAAAQTAQGFISNSPSKLKHAFEFSFDAALAARALSQIPLFEALSSPDLAGLLAASAEVGPLLLHTDSVTGWVEGGGKAPVRLKVSWTLSAAK